MLIYIFSEYDFFFFLINVALIFQLMYIINMCVHVCVCVWVNVYFFPNMNDFYIYFCIYLFKKKFGGVNVALIF